MEIVGLGFRPTDEELVNYYLKHKLLDDDPRVHVIPDIDLCEVEPQDVPLLLADSAVRFNEREWFFFSPVDYKYSNSKRLNRTTKCGFWKPTGKDREIRSKDTNNVIGTKKTLVYYEGKASRGVKSNWVIHEYHAVTSFHQSQKPGKTTEEGTDASICDEGEPSRLMVSHYENQATAEGVPSGGAFTGMERTFQGMHEYTLPTGIEQEEPSFTNYAFSNVYFRNEDNVMQTPSETKEEDEFLNSILVINNEESMHAFANSSTQSVSSKTRKLNITKD